MTTWHRFAACADQPTSTFFPDCDAGETYAAARAICAGCPVTRACLAENIRERHGMFGNTTPSERAKIARKRADTVACTGCGVALGRSTRRGGPQAWCAAESCQKEAARQRTEAWRQRRGVA